MLSVDELTWLNDYHARVNREVRGHLDDKPPSYGCDDATARMLTAVNVATPSLVP